jgi:hypothetical protein
MDRIHYRVQGSDPGCALLDITPHSVRRAARDSSTGQQRRQGSRDSTDHPPGGCWPRARGAVRSFPFVVRAAGGGLLGVQPSVLGAAAAMTIGDVALTGFLRECVVGVVEWCWVLRWC